MTVRDERNVSRPTGAGALALDGGRAAGPGPLRALVDRVVAVGYGLTYDLVVRGFPPYEALVDEIVAFVGRSAALIARPAPPTVLDVACGTGSVAVRLARSGYRVVGLDTVSHLVDVARKRSRDVADAVEYHHRDIARNAVPGAGTYDILLSMHTLYWHPNPGVFLEACRRVLRPGGCGIFLTYSRPARVGRVFREIERGEGLGPAIRALRWLVPTAVFETFRGGDQDYMTAEQFTRALAHAGFDVLETRRTFLGQLSLLGWVRAPRVEAGRD